MSPIVERLVARSEASTLSHKPNMKNMKVCACQNVSNEHRSINEDILSEDVVVLEEKLLCVAIVEKEIA